MIAVTPMGFASLYPSYGISKIQKVAAMSMFGFPLLLIPLAVVNIIAFLMPGVSLSAPMYTVPLTSGVSWTITFSDALLAFGMLLLFFEAAKTVRPNGKYLTDHLLSFLVFGGATAEFVMLPQFGNSTFFLLTVLAFVDFVSGITLHVRLRRLVGVRTRAAVAPQRPEPTISPAPGSRRLHPTLARTPCWSSIIRWRPAPRMMSRRHRTRQSRRTNTGKSSGARAKSGWIEPRLYLSWPGSRPGHLA